MFCNQCGQEVTVDNKFCTNCGALVPTPSIITPPEAEHPLVQLSSIAETRVGTQRNAGLVILYSIISLGIYHLVWYYMINKEIALHDPEQRFSPGLATWALFLPIASWVTLYNTANRIKIMQIQDNSRDLISPGAALAWAILFGLGYYVVIQGALNNHWHAHLRSVANQ